MVRLDELAAEPITFAALNSAVKATGSPTRDVFERTAVALRQAWEANTTLTAEATAAVSAKKVAESRLAGIGNVLAAGGNYSGDPLVDVAELRAFAIRLDEVRKRMLAWATQPSALRGPEGQAMANAVVTFLQDIKPPAALAK